MPPWSFPKSFSNEGGWVRGGSKLQRGCSMCAYLYKNQNTSVVHVCGMCACSVCLYSVFVCVYVCSICVYVVCEWGTVLVRVSIPARTS